MEAAPPLSVVVPTRAGWPAYRPYFVHHQREVESVGGELLVIDGSGRPAPPAEALGPRTRWLSHPGESVLGLRALGYPLGRGEIVATSEDHTRVLEGWAAAVLRAHAEHPEAAAIGGAVECGQTNGYVDWAAFVVGHDREIPPLSRGRPLSVVGITNVSYKRSVLAGLRPIRGIGINDAVFQRALARGGATLLTDDRIGCEHEQHMTFRQATVLLLHAGQMSAGSRRAGMTLREAGRALITPTAPILLTARLGLWLAQRRRDRMRYVVELPMIIWLFGARAVGELVGYARGAGDSALLLH